jgi:uncharacterized protein
MQINVAQLLKEPVGAERNYKIDELTGENKADHVEGEIILTRTNLGILVTGKLVVDMQGLCSRCLEPAFYKAPFCMEDEYYPVIDVNSGAHVRVEPDAFTIDQNHILDLDEAIRQYIITATPTRLLCKSDCPGIHPVTSNESARGNSERRNKSCDHRWDKLVEATKKESKI